MPAEDVQALRLAVEARFGTVYRFVRASGLNKSTVYMVLAGTYPAKGSDRQMRRIREALEGSTPREERIYAAIKAVACARCSGRRAGCGSCDALFREQALAVAAMDSHIG